MDINRIFSFEDETALEAYNTLNGVDLALENRIGFAESEESYWIMKGTDGTLEITGSDFNQFSETTTGTLNAQNLKIASNSHFQLNSYFYFAENLIVDSEGDWRFYADTNGFYFEVCTVPALTKGGGTWVNKSTFLSGIL